MFPSFYFSLIYAFIEEKWIDIDQTNPQPAVCLVSSFGTWQEETEDRRDLMKAQLKCIQEEETFPDIIENLGRSLA